MASPSHPVLGRAPCLMMWASSRLLRTAVHVAAPWPSCLKHFDPVHSHTSRCRQEEAVIAGLLLREITAVVYELETSIIDYVIELSRVMQRPPEMNYQFTWW